MVLRELIAAIFLQTAMSAMVPSIQTAEYIYVDAGCGQVTNLSVTHAANGFIIIGYPRRGDVSTRNTTTCNQTVAVQGGQVLSLRLPMIYFKFCSSRFTVTGVKDGNVTFQSSPFYCGDRVAPSAPVDLVKSAPEIDLEFSPATGEENPQLRIEFAIHNIDEPPIWPRRGPLSTPSTATPTAAPTATPTAAATATPTTSLSTQTTGQSSETTASGRADSTGRTPPLIISDKCECYYQILQPSMPNKLLPIAEVFASFDPAENAYHHWRYRCNSACRSEAQRYLWRDGQEKLEEKLCSELSSTSSLSSPAVVRAVSKAPGSSTLKLSYTVSKSFCCGAQQQRVACGAKTGANENGNEFG